MKTGEKRMVFYPSKPFIPCDRTHPDYLLRVKDLTVDLSRPAHREKSPVLRTGDL